MSSFENLLQKDGSVSIHNRNFQVLTTEMFKVNRGNLSSTMKGIIEPRTERICSFQSISDFFELLVNTVFHGRERVFIP